MRTHNLTLTISLSLPPHLPVCLALAYVLNLCDVLLLWGLPYMNPLLSFLIYCDNFFISISVVIVCSYCCVVIVVASVLCLWLKLWPCPLHTMSSNCTSLVFLVCYHFLLYVSVQLYLGTVCPSNQPFLSQAGASCQAIIENKNLFLIDSPG